MKNMCLVVDCETGGLNPYEHSILTLGAVVMENGKISKGDRFYAVIKEPNLMMTKEAEYINGLSKTFIENRGQDPQAVAEEFQAWLRQWEWPSMITLAGTNTDFDRAFIDRLYNQAGMIHNFSHRSLDIQTGGNLLQHAGIIELPDGEASLDNLCTLFGVHRTAKSFPHHALEDAVCTAEVLEKMLDLLMTLPTP